MNKPLSVKAIQAIATMQITLVVILALYITYAINSSPSPGSAEFRFRAGFFDGMHASPETFGAGDFGYFIGNHIINILLAGLILFFLTGKNLLGVRIVSGLQLLFGLSGIPIIPLILVILSFLSSTKSYFNGDFEETERQDEPTS